MNLKDGWYASNHNLNSLLQVFNSQRRILWVEIKELNLQALAQHRETSAAPCNVLPSSANPSAPLSSQSYAKPNFMGPQNCCDWNPPVTIIKDFRAVLGNMQDAMHHVTIYNGTQEFLKHKGHNKMYISDEPLHAKELCIYHGLKGQGGGLHGECISQICR